MTKSLIEQCKDKIASEIVLTSHEVGNDQVKAGIVLGLVKALQILQGKRFVRKEEISLRDAGYDAPLGTDA